MMRDRVTSRERLGNKTYTWAEITTITTSLIILGICTYLIIFALNGVI
jgi:hypothetical protein